MPNSENSHTITENLTEKNKLHILLEEIKNLTPHKLKEIRAKLKNLLTKERETDTISSIENKNTDEIEQIILNNLNYIMSPEINNIVFQNNNISPEKFKLLENTDPLKIKIKKEIMQLKSKRLQVTTIYNFFTEMEKVENNSETDIFSLDEIKSLDIIQEKLKSNEELVNKITFLIIEKQRKLMEKRNVDPNIIKIEIQHITEVVLHSQVLYPENFLLHFIAAAHDSMKRIKGTYTELGLHEFTSAMFGPQLIVESISDILSTTNPPKTDLFKQEDLSLIKKFARRAIYTHGDYEWPENNSEEIDDLNSEKQILSLKNYWLYLRNRNIRANFKSKHKILETFAQINALDMLTGTNLNSFIKYINDSSKDAIEDNLYKIFFVKNEVFGSLYSNLNNLSLWILTNDKESQATKIINEYQKRMYNFQEVVLFLFGWNIEINNTEEAMIKMGYRKNSPDYQNALSEFNKLYKMKNEFSSFMYDGVYDGTTPIRRDGTQREIDSSPETIAKNKQHIIDVLTKVTELMNAGSTPLNILLTPQNAPSQKD